MQASEASNNNCPCKDKDVLERLYVDERMHATDIAEKLNCSHNIVYYWLDKYDIERRERAEICMINAGKSPTPFLTNRDGHEWWRTRIEGEKLCVRVHRLLAVSEFGMDAIKEKDIHHKNNIPWDNRPENIEPMTRSEHSAHHSNPETFTKRVVTREQCDQMGDMADDHSIRDIADEFDVSGATVGYHLNGKCDH